MSAPAEAEILRDIQDAGTRIQVKGEDGNSGLVPKCCPEPYPVMGGIIEFHGERGRRQGLYCERCKGTIAVLSWSVG